MRALLRNTAVLFLCMSLLAGVCSAKQVYLRGGGIIDCESFWRRGDQVTVKVNRDVVIDFDRNEIDMRRTFSAAARKRHALHRHNSAGSAVPALAATPAAAAATVPAPAAPSPPKPKALPHNALAAAPATAPAAQKASVPAAAPVVKENVQPEPAQPVANPSSPAGKAELEHQSKKAAEMMTEAIQKKDPELLKKAVEAQRAAINTRKHAAEQGNVPPAPVAPVGLLLLLIAVCLLIIVSMWVVFEKGGQSGWKSLIPFYNAYILMEVSGKPGWWMFLLFIPFIGAVVYLLAMLSLAGRYGRGPLFGIGLFFLPMVFFPLLAFGGSGKQTQEPAFQFS